MPVALRLDVPRELGCLLLDQDFYEPYSGRGDASPDIISAVMLMAGSIASLGADSMTVLLGLELLGTLVKHVRSWLRGSPTHGTELRATVVKNGKTLSATLRIDGDATSSDA